MTAPRTLEGILAIPYPVHSLDVREHAGDVVATLRVHRRINGQVCAGVVTEGRGPDVGAAIANLREAVQEELDEEGEWWA